MDCVVCGGACGGQITNAGEREGHEHALACTVVECATGTDRQGSTCFEKWKVLFCPLYFDCTLGTRGSPAALYIRSTCRLARPTSQGQSSSIIRDPINGPRMASASPLAHQQREFHTRTHTTHTLRTHCMPIGVPHVSNTHSLLCHSSGSYTEPLLHPCTHSRQMQIATEDGLDALHLDVHTHTQQSRSSHLLRAQGRRDVASLLQAK